MSYEFHQKALQNQILKGFYYKLFIQTSKIESRTSTQRISFSLELEKLPLALQEREPKALVLHPYASKSNPKY